VFIDTLHPVHEGRLFRWGHDPTESALLEYGRTSPAAIAAGGANPHDVRAAESWRHSPFYRMLQTGDSLITRFDAEGVIGEMDGVYTSWATRTPDGFSEDHIAALGRIVPYLALAIKSVALARMAATLMETYLGRDAGQRVLGGRIVTRYRGADRRRRLVQRPAGVHAHHRYCTGAGHSTAQRLLRCNRLGDPRTWR
jgi:adenylate cyclase